MTQQERIEKASIEYANILPQGRISKKYCAIDFTAGANWALSNQWHDAKIDNPDLSCRILAYLSWGNFEVCSKKSPEVLNVAEKPYKHYYDLGGEEVPISAIKYWMEIPPLKGGEE